MRQDFATLQSEVKQLQKNTHPGGLRFWLPTGLAGVAAIASVLSLFL